MSSYCAISPTSSAPWLRSRATTSSISSTANMMRRMPSAFAGASSGSALTAGGAWNLVSSTRPWPSGARIMVMSARTSLSPTVPSTQGPSPCVSPSSSIPSSAKNSFAASRSSTTMRTLSIRWSVISREHRVAFRCNALPAKPGGLERFGAGPEDLTPGDQAVRERDDLPGSVFERDAAGPAACRDHDGDEDPVITQVDHLLDLDMDALLRVLQHHPYPLTDLFGTAVQLGDPRETFQRLPDDVRAEEGQHGLEVTPV